MGDGSRFRTVLGKPRINSMLVVEHRKKTMVKKKRLKSSWNSHKCCEGFGGWKPFKSQTVVLCTVNITYSRSAYLEFMCSEGRLNWHCWAWCLRNTFQFFQHSKEPLQCSAYYNEEAQKHSEKVRLWLRHGLNPILATH